MIENGLLNHLSDILSSYQHSSYVLFLDKTTNELFGNQVQKELSLLKKKISKFVIEGTEESKNIDTLVKFLSFLKKEGMDRKGCLIAVGGGVIGDIATVAAGLYFRGIDCIQIPTTLLAQVDSAIGGKGAINIGTHKNTIGIIRQPRLVIVDTELLASLPKEQFTSGMAEVVKYAIAFDNELFEKLQTTKDLRSKLPWIINRCITIKMGIVKKDPLEQNIRALVNFGHTVGQAIELLAKIPHGYAIAIGMTFAIKVSVRMHLLHKSMADAALELIKQYKLPTTVQGLSVNDIYRQIHEDKKTVSNVPRFVLLTKIGEVKPNQIVPEEIILDVLQEILL